MPRTTKNSPRQDVHTVAKLAKVSIATVSRVINHKPSVDPAIADRVWKAIKKLNYHPNYGARAMVSGRSHMLGLLVSRITNPFFPELIEGFEQIASINGFEIMISAVGQQPGYGQEAVRRMLSRNVEGAAIMTHGMSAADLEEFKIYGTPLVFIDAAPAPDLGSVVQLDYENGIRDAVQHLAVLGHRRIWFISGPLDRCSSTLRQQAFIKAMEEIGVLNAAAQCIAGDHTLEGAIRAADILFQKAPTAVICSNDLTAVSVLRKAAEKKLQVPSQLSVIGFDDIDLAKFVSPPLTTVSVDRYRLAQAAFHSLMQRLADPQTLPPLQLLPVRLVVRQSTSYAPSAAQELPPL
jgi:LacI family transcriptional regulator